MCHTALDRALAQVPYYMRESVLGYLDNGQPPGDFLQAVLENNLHWAGCGADAENQAALFGWAAVLDALPMNVWGSREKVDAHIDHHYKLREEQTSCKK